jgi:hypothetical protein
MKIIKTLLLAFAISSLNINSSYSKISDYGFEENEDYIEIIDIENIYAPRRLRKILDYYSKLDLSKKINRDEVDKIQNISAVKPIDQYLKLFKEKFITMQINKLKHKNDDCGEGNYELSIIINPKAMEVLIITITEDNKICQIMDGDIKNKRYRYEYYISDYMDYWL